MEVNWKKLTRLIYTKYIAYIILLVIVLYYVFTTQLIVFDNDSLLSFSCLDDCTVFYISLQYKIWHYILIAKW